MIIIGLIGIDLAVAGCSSSPSRTISQSTEEIPKCAQPQGVLVVDNLRCDRHLPCADPDTDTAIGKGMWYADRYSRGGPADHYARAKGIEGNTLGGLRGAHKKFSSMLITALQATGCFALVESYSWGKDQHADWRVGGNVDKLFAFTNEILPTEYTRARHKDSKQDALADITVEIHQTDELKVWDKRRFHVQGKRVRTESERGNEHDWSRARNEKDFDDTAMQDVANEIVTEAAVYVTEKLAGPRVTGHVALSSLKPASTGSAGEAGPTSQGAKVNASGPTP